MRQWAVESKTFTNGDFDQVTAINPFTRAPFTEAQAREWVDNRVTYGAYTHQTIRVVCAEHGPWEPADQARPSDSVESIIAFEAERWISRAEISQVDVSASDIAADSAVALLRAGLLVSAADQPVQYVRPTRREISQAVYAAAQDVAPGSDGIDELTEALVAVLPVRTEQQVRAEAIREVAQRLLDAGLFTPQVRDALGVAEPTEDHSRVASSEQT